MIGRAIHGSRSSLVGRQRELATLWSEYDIVLGGHARVALVAGEPGIGKTRLLDAFATRAAAAGALVLRGGSSESAGMPPYLPFLEALGQYVRTTDVDVLRELTAPTAGILASILPELILRLGEIPASPPLPNEQARLRLYEAVSAMLAAIAYAQPLVLLLDDLQWADPSSLDLLCFVVRFQLMEARAGSSRLMVLGAYRAGEIELNRSFQRSYAELNRLRLLTSITLRRFEPDELIELATGYLGAPLTSATEHVLFTQSEGNPFFAEELLRGWYEAGRLVSAAGRWELRTPSEPALPQSIVAAVRGRLGRLDPEIVKLLEVAAIIGRDFDPLVLAEVLGQEVEVIEDRLLIAERAALIRSEVGGLYIFNHDTIRETLYTAVPSSRRRRLHGFVGRALEGSQDQASRLAEIAFHFKHSGDRARGASSARRAAEQALSAYAFEEAVGHYQTALELGSSQERGVLLMALGAAAVLAGTEHVAVTAFKDAQEWFQATGDRVAAARAAHRAGQACVRQEAIVPAQVAFEATLAILGDQVTVEHVEVLIDLGTLLAVSLHRQPEGLAYGRRALEIAHFFEDDRLIAASSRMLGNMLVRSNDLPGGIALLEEALMLAMSVDDSLEIAECCACLGLAYVWNGDLRGCYTILSRQIDVARRCHDRYQLRHIDTNRAGLQCVEGHFAEAEMLIAGARPMVESLESHEPLAFLEFTSGQIAYQRGDYQVAEQCFAHGAALLRSTHPGTLVWYVGQLGIVQAALGQREAALATAAEVGALIDTLPVGSMPTAEPLTHLMILALDLGDRTMIADLYPRLLPFQGQYHDALVDRLLGVAESLWGDWPAARAHLQAAETIARREHFEPELARTLIAQAALLHMHDGSDGRPLLHEAHGIMHRAGMVAEARRIDQRIAALTQEVRPNEARRVNDLTAREVEVLVLIASGKSNRDVATDLVLSVRTVERHITNIYAKIGARGKADATIFAVRHGLV